MPRKSAKHDASWREARLGAARYAAKISCPKQGYRLFCLKMEFPLPAFSGVDVHKPDLADQFAAELCRPVKMMKYRLRT
jgi:hypothetical protein